MQQGELFAALEHGEAVDSEGPAVLQAWLQERLIRPLDYALADFCLQLAANEAPVAMLAALLSRQLQDGHVCLRLDVLQHELATLGVAGSTGQGPVQWWSRRTLSEWLQVLRNSPLVTTQPQIQPAPLVLISQRLYLYRMWQHEARVALRVTRSLQHNTVPDDGFAARLEQLFPAQGAGNDWQKIACAMAASGRFTLITGGPGTGKTTTVVRLLALLQQQALQQQSTLHIRLAAPTGKAAARLTESIGGQIAALPVSEEVRAHIPDQVSTLHRLLGSLPDTRRFRHHAGNPLLLDVLVVDEASMIDLEMMDNLLQALPAHARLILLGDKDQLASVEAGSVLGELCLHAAAGHYAPETLARLEQLGSGVIDMHGLQIGDARQYPLEQRTVMLRHSRRFAGDSGIGRLAAAVNAMDAGGALGLLRQQLPDVTWAKAGRGVLQELVRNGFQPYVKLLHQHSAASASGEAFSAWAGDLLQAFERFRVLCALREGDWGVTGLNQLVEQSLAGDLQVSQDSPWYAGRPVMVTRNDYGLGLMNGDIGIAVQVPEEGGPVLRVVFPRNDGSNAVRFVLPSRLTAVETVFAMTVHKSQGSEFDHCALVLPDSFSPVLTKELLYTGITRARKHLTLLAAAEPVLQQAIGRQVERHSGLREAIEVCTGAL